MASPHDNALRYRPGDAGHVESYFLRGNAPDRKLAFWLKATVFAPRADSAVAELWCIVFDAENGRYWSEKRTVPFAHAVFEGEPATIRVAQGEFYLADEGYARGSIEGQGGSCEWNIKWQRQEGSVGDRLCLLPSEKMVDGSFPKSTPLTPFPSLLMEGSIDVWGETIDLDGWVGMQGHNWGDEHAWEYAWGHCPFLDEAGEPFCWVEGFSARTRIAGRVTPIISALVIRRGDEEYRFDRLVDLWRQDAAIDLDEYVWRLELRGAHGEAALSMAADPEEMVCLGYHNPDGRLSYCLNSKLAKVHLRVNPVNEAAFECESAHGGALEFLRNSPDPVFERVV